MSATQTLSHLSLSAGGAAATAGLHFVRWGTGHIARAPMASAVLVVFLTGSLGAVTNAVLLQDGPHPAPLFGVETTATTPVAPVVPAPPIRRPYVAPGVPLAGAPEPAATRVAGEILGNAEVFEIQTKLASLSLFDGKVDGYYGPQTASAIRAFELRNGLKPRGALTPDIHIAIRRAEQPGMRPAAVPAPALPSRTKPETIAIVDPALITVAPEPEATAPAPAEITVPDLLIEIARSAARTPAAIPVTEPVVPVAPLAQPVAPVVETLAVPTAPAADQVLIASIQRGLASLGFLHAKIDGVAGDATAKAIRNFEVYFNYDVTGKIAPELVDMLTSAGAVM